MMYFTKTKIKKRKIRFLLFIISLISFSSYSQSTNNYNLSTQFSFHITLKVSRRFLYQINKFKQYFYWY